MSWCLFFNSLSSPFPSISWYLGFNGSRDHCLYPQRWAGRLGHRAAGKGSRSERGGLCWLVPRCPPPSTLTTTPSPPPLGLVKKCTLGGEVFVHGHGWWDSPHDLRTTRPCFSLPPLRTPPHLGRQTSAPRTGLLPLRASPQPPHQSRASRRLGCHARGGGAPPLRLSQGMPGKQQLPSQSRQAGAPTSRGAPALEGQGPPSQPRSRSGAEPGRKPWPCLLPHHCAEFPVAPTFRTELTPQSLPSDSIGAQEDAARAPQGPAPCFQASRGSQLLAWP